MSGDLRAVLGDVATLLLEADTLAAGIDRTGEVLDDDPVGDEEAAALYLLSDEVVRMARDVKAALEARVIERVEASAEKRLIAEGKTFLTRWSKARRAWDNDALRSAVARVAVVTEDGEARPAADVWELVTEAFNLAGGNVRTTWLKAHGIDPDDFAGEVDEAKVSLNVQGEDE